MSPAIDYFNLNHPLMNLQVRASLRVRQAMFDRLPLEPGMKTLEVGATPETRFADLNFFSERAAARGCEVWVTSIEDCSELAAKKGWHWIPMNQVLKKRQEGLRFDMVISAAVLEHVGETPQKKEHLQFLDQCTDRYLADLRRRAVSKAHDHPNLADRQDLKLSTVEWMVATDDGYLGWDI